MPKISTKRLARKDSCADDCPVEHAARFLEDEGLIRKTVYPEVPPRTEYELTAQGRRLRPVIEAMAKFGAIMQRSA